MEKPTPDVSIDEIDSELRQMAQDMLSELERVKAESRHNEPGYTVVELAVAWGITKSAAKKTVAQLKKAGRITEGRAYRADKTGRYLPVRVVRLREKEE